MSKDFQKMWTELGVNLENHDRLLEHEAKKHERAFLSQKNRPEGMAYFDEALHASHAARCAEIPPSKRIRSPGSGLVALIKTETGFLGGGGALPLFPTIPRSAILPRLTGTDCTGAGDAKDRTSNCYWRRAARAR